MGAVSKIDASAVQARLEEFRAAPNMRSAQKVASELARVAAAMAELDAEIVARQKMLTDAQRIVTAVEEQLAVLPTDVQERFASAMGGVATARATARAESSTAARARKAKP